MNNTKLQLLSNLPHCVTFKVGDLSIFLKKICSNSSNKMDDINCSLLHVVLNFQLIVCLMECWNKSCHPPQKKLQLKMFQRNVYAMTCNLYINKLYPHADLLPFFTPSLNCVLLLSLSYCYKFMYVC